MLQPDYEIFLYIYIYIWAKFSYKIGCSFKVQPFSISHLLEVNFDKFTIRLHLLFIFSILENFLKELKINSYVINKLF